MTMQVTELLTVLLLLAGAGFFLAGTVGLLRFPDVYTRLHAITKADNVGLGFFVVAGLVLQAESWAAMGKLLLIWLLVLLASASVAHLVARTALRKGIRAWKR
jgi:multicomponent Na+:H+ antiporter subunit G